ncbi:hypothetical protein VCRA2122O12_190073 [Vibrio crassostreae]|nr:hypothetical protein VCRA2110O1_210006 [Vibrio crassostreae]CAK1881751.1 hypothetical protein VCRA2110O4_210006 [Vibrio crassostreae]CAK2110625.1 hypothetical protein VCRA2114E5_60019 [Vibrio crassostreae]CAK2619353.1 hypothetical protein VCRA2110O2_190019 [Vibrio crassostreae]CAK2665952.1 hypothetical protein VCRA2122O10_170073 [Vibrio crassostreae]
MINDEYKYRVRVSFEKNKRLGYVKTKSMFSKYKMPLSDSLNGINDQP